jgi:hypothetical protein
MSNASRCRATAATYARMAEATANPALRRSYQTLERLWLDMAPFAEDFDRRHGDEAKERIYDMMDAVAEQQRQVA